MPDILMDVRLLLQIMLSIFFGEAGLDYIFVFGETHRVATVKTGGKQMSTGHLQLMGSSPLLFHIKNKGHP